MKEHTWSGKGGTALHRIVEEDGGFAVYTKVRQPAVPWSRNGNFAPFGTRSEAEEWMDRKYERAAGGRA